MAAYEASMRLWTVRYEGSILSPVSATRILSSAVPRMRHLLSFCIASSCSLTVWVHNIADLESRLPRLCTGYHGPAGQEHPGPAHSRSSRDGRMGDRHLRWPRNKSSRCGRIFVWRLRGSQFCNTQVGRLRKLVLLTPIGSFVPLKIQFLFVAC